MSSIDVIKRDGSVEDFDVEKLSDSIMNAALAVGGEDYDLADEIANNILDILESNEIEEINTEDLQNIVEKTLIEDGHAATAKEYILKAADRNRMREMDTALMKSFEEITFKSEEDSEIKRENANIDSSTAMGTMLKYGSEGAKNFNLLYMMSEDIAAAHKNCDIHIHDLDFLALTETCMQIPLDRLFLGGFNTGHGFLRQPGGIRTAAALAAIAIQSDQNDQHGGQSIPMLDYYLAPYVALSYVKTVAHVAKIKLDLTKDQEKSLKRILVAYQKANGCVMSDEKKIDIFNILKKWFEREQMRISKKKIDKILEDAHEDTYEETFQAMEAFIHNLNTMHSRAGAQVPFSSVNFGTDTSKEGRMVIKNYLLAVDAGLGHGETPIFPISIFKVKEGVNYFEEDPNYDLFRLACKVSAKRLFPNFSFLDSTFNKPFLKEGDYDTEVGYMGCRTRVLANVCGPSITPGRGNLSFTSINLPRLGIKHGIALGEEKADMKGFYEELDNLMDLVKGQLLQRFECQCSKSRANFKFLLGAGVWINSEKLENNSKLRTVLKHGTLSIGFIGLAETLKALIGEHHGESEKAQKLGEEIIKHMRDKCDEYTKEYNLNFTLLATPAEGLSGRFVAMDRSIYGKIKGVTDRDYYTNSFHVPVYYKTTVKHKLEVEGVYHKYTNAGHISYIELDGDTVNNVEAFESVVRIMHDSDIGYGAINHPVDRDPICGYVGVIKDICPKCGRRANEGVSVEKLKNLGCTICK